MSPSRARRSVAWAVLGAIVLIVALVAIVISISTRNGDRPSPPSPSGSSAPGPSPTTATAPPTGASDVVDPSVARNGWLPEPITRDKDAYIRAALEAASTFAPQAATREKFLAYLGTWFTYDTRWQQQSDRESSKARYLLELDQSVVIPEDQWEDLRTAQTMVTAKVAGPITYVTVPDNPGGMYIGTADVTVHYSSGSGGTPGDDRRVRVSVQVLCSPETVPTANTAQRAGDCKVVRYFPSAVEQ